MILTKNVNDNINMKDISKVLSFNDLSAGVRKTRIRIYEVAEDGTETLKNELHNRVVITGSAATGATMFGIGYPFEIPTYNSEMDLENSVYTEDPENPQLITLFCIGDSGCGATESDVFEPKYVDRIAPVNDIVPFRYVEPSEDLSPSERLLYYGRKPMDDGNIAYYFKKFESEPKMFMRYADGTEMDASMYNTQTTQEAECFVKFDLVVSRLDCRDYFDKVIGWDHARISTISLCSAWYTEDENEMKWYQDILPFTKLNFSFERLVDSTKALKFEYSLFF